MAGIFDYLKWRGDIPMSAVPLCDADRLILSQLVYMELDVQKPTRLADVCRRILARLSLSRAVGSNERILHLETDERLLTALSESPRFRDLIIISCEKRFSSEEEEQFYAMTVRLPYRCVAVVYRGTDWSLVGWKEDFNMAFSDVLPAQRRAVRYLNAVGKRYNCRLDVFGHSKGGNLAVYASAFCDPEVRARIVRVTNLDGPGFPKRIADRVEVGSLKSRIKTYMPKSSIVASLMSGIGRTTVVRCRSAGLLQHIPYNWEIEGGGFVTAKRDTVTKCINDALNRWIESLTKAERRMFVNTIWEVLKTTGAYEIQELFRGNNLFVLIKNYIALDSRKHKIIRNMLQKLNRFARESLIEVIKNN